jgi:hypothetical protein
MNKKFAALSVFAILISSNSFALVRGQIGTIFKGCGSCDHKQWNSNQGQYYVQTCDVIGPRGHEQQEEWGCDPDLSQACTDLEFKLLNQVSRSQKACDTARAEYAKQSCGELGWPDCALFSR